MGGRSKHKHVSYQQLVIGEIAMVFQSLFDCATNTSLKEYTMQFLKFKWRYILDCK